LQGSGPAFCRLGWYPAYEEIPETERKKIMSTNADYLIKKHDGGFIHLYQHWDGYPAVVLPIIAKAIEQPDSIKARILATEKPMVEYRQDTFDDAPEKLFKMLIDRSLSFGYMIDPIIREVSVFVKMDRGGKIQQVPPLFYTHESGYPDAMQAMEKIWREGWTINDQREDI
jgi:hypothetical protein